MLVPNLQLIPPDWEPGRPLDRSLNLPKRWEKHPVEDCYCNTYYYDLTHKRELQKCQVSSFFIFFINLFPSPTPLSSFPLDS